jgi:hypothetical protein
MRFILAIACLASGLALAADPVGITTKGYYELWVKGGAKVSQHTSEREAVQKALNSGPNVYEIRQPVVEVTVAKAFNVAFPDCGTGRCTPTPEQIAAARQKRMPLVIANTRAWIDADTGAPRWPLTLEIR